MSSTTTGSSKKKWFGRKKRHHADGREKSTGSSTLAVDAVEEKAPMAEAPPSTVGYEDDETENSVKEPSGIKPHEPPQISDGLHPLALSLDKATAETEKNMDEDLTLATLKAEMEAMKQQMKTIIGVQEDHIEHIAERFRLGDFTVTLKRDLTALFEDNDFCIHFRGSCDRTKNHDIHGDVSGLHLRLTLRKRISKKNPKPILSGFIYFYPNEEEEGQTGIFCRSEIDFWGLPKEVLSDDSGDEKEDPKEKKKKKKRKSLFGKSKSKKDSEHADPDGPSPTDIPDAEKPDWQKLFDMEHQYTNDGEGFGKWNVMLWDDFKRRVVTKEGKVVLRMKVGNIQRFFET